MSEEKWDIIFNNWNDRKQTYYIVRVVIVCSIILTSFLAVFGFITGSEFRYFSLLYIGIFIIVLVLFHFFKHPIFLFIFLSSMIIGFPIWMYFKQDPHVVAYIAVMLVITAAVVTDFRFTSAIFAFMLVNLIIFALLDLFDIYIHSGPDNSLTISALLHIPLLTTGYITAFYVNKVLMNSLKTQKQQFELLKTTQQQLINQEKFKSIRLLAGGIAHDFNNLLTVILGNINLLRLDLLHHPESLELVEEVENAAIQARDLTKELLTFSKETIHLQEVVKIPELLNKSAKFASSGSKTKTIVEIAPNLWRIQGNPTQLSQVFQNLILNARQAMQDSPQGGIIRIFANNLNLVEPNKYDIKSGSYVHIKVIDTGKGINPEEISKIFNPYFSTKIGSHGLGLAICHTIVRNHSGTISVESDPGKETQFEILLPANLESVQRNAVKENGDILILEDDVNIIRVLEKNISRIGLSLDFASSCEEVKRLLSDSVENGTPYKIIILDSSIPVDGHLCESSQILKKIHNKVKIILYSDLAIHPVIKNYKQNGFDAYLPKGSDIRDIRNLILSLTLNQSTV
ncbi:MAG: hybrid sensor histidine kinase/response regulator [Promethearchaeota archaeon]|nr:MAG: hybrid sensor histidine kinase/response regulator [Candidatus Lokiarchaeota archaeon]